MQRDLTVSCGSLPSFDKDALLLAEISPPFAADAAPMVFFFRPPFELAPRPVVVDARQLLDPGTGEAT
jgi:hypothetical protein